MITHMCTHMRVYSPFILGRKRRQQSHPVMQIVSGFWLQVMSTGLWPL